MNTPTIDGISLQKWQTLIQTHMSDRFIYLFCVFYFENNSFPFIKICKQRFLFFFFKTLVAFTLFFFFFETGKY